MILQPASIFRGDCTNLQHVHNPILLYAGPRNFYFFHFCITTHSFGSSYGNLFIRSFLISKKIILPVSFEKLSKQHANGLLRLDRALDRHRPQLQL
jgi:hypothetical protein